MDSAYNILYKLVALIIRVICRINGGLDIKGRENIPYNEGAIIASNHISYLDPPVIGAVLPRRGVFMARKGLFDIPLLGWLIKRAAFPVDREKTGPSTIKAAIKKLKNGELVIMFPEGKRSETGQLLEAKRGIGMVAGLSKAPIVPTVVVGTDKALPVNVKWLKRARIKVVFGRPIYYPSAIDGKSQRGHLLHEHISNTIMTAIGELKNNYSDKSC
ncbi:MAG: 1-acyl-sn-glycerol-3-phosphate acyltransferase [Thermodesulfovibrionia bacterium]|nr:1-acyl-sn-glycerol-3-phosphate acyltransferase [Thermodesulfovibrionia bacterium]